MRYFRPSSVSWWSGFAMIAMGFLTIFYPSHATNELGILLTTLMGGQDASPAGMVLMGLAVIGLRDKMERGDDGSV